MSVRQPDALAVVQLLLAKYQREVVQPLLARLTELEALVAAHTRRLERGHCGPYQRGALYETGDEVMVHGSTFRAQLDDPSGPPPGDGWVMVAQGRKRNPARTT